MKTEMIVKDTYRRNADGTTTLIKSEMIEAEVLPTQEELVAQKEAALLAMYEELQALKNNQ